MTSIKEANSKNMDGVPFTDVVMIKNIKQGSTRQGSTFYSGSLATKDKEDYGFKVWGSEVGKIIKDALDKSKGTGYLVVEIDGKINIYMGTTGVVINAVRDVPLDKYPITTFLKSDYTVKDLSKRLVIALKDENSMDSSKHISTEGQNLIKDVFKNTPDYVKSVAALGHHDNQIHGLMGHSVKMLEIGRVVLHNYPHLFKTQKEIDLFMLGIALHDIGKTLEYAGFTASDEAFLTHRYLGTLILDQYKEEIVKSYGEMWYKHLLAVLLQHHGIYEERPKTVMSYAVHLVDMLESSMASLDTSVKQAEEKGNERLFVSATDGTSFGLTRYQGEDTK